jgi:KaiC/GvpD/RAD55 family RecA-like ATPase
MATVYTDDLQKLFIEFMITDSELFVRTRNIISPTYFSKKYFDTVEMLIDHADKYKSLPTIDQIKAKCEIDFTPVPNLDEAQKDWFLDEFETFCRHKALEKAIIESADLLERSEYGTVEDKIKEAVRIGLTKDLGTDYFEDPRARLMKLKDSNGQVSTGWKSLDKKLYGGFNRGELNIFAGSSGAGKSLFLQNIAMNFLELGQNVIYFTFELSEELSAMRVDSMTTGVPTNEIFKKIDEVELAVKLKRQKQGGSFQIKYMPSGSNTNDIRSYVKEFTIQKGVAPDVVLVDYLDLMFPVNKKISPADMFIKDKFVSEELRNFAVEQQIVLVTASQLNRGAIEEVEYDQSHIAGGISKINTADNLIGIFTSRAMRERGRYQIQLIKTRSSGGVGSKIDLAFDVDRLRITDLDEDDEGVNIMPASGESIAQTLTKRTSTVTNKTQASAVAEKTEMAKGLRDLLKAQSQQFDE